MKQVLKLVFVAWCAVSVSAYSQSAEPTELEKEEHAQLRPLRDKEKNRFLSRLSKEKKARYLAVGFAGPDPILTPPAKDRDYINGYKGSLNWAMRIALDDQPTIEYLSSEKSKSAFHTISQEFANSQSPNAIIYWSQWLFSDEAYAWEGFDVKTLVPSFQALNNMLELLPVMDELPEPVRDWARSFNKMNDILIARSSERRQQLGRNMTPEEYAVSTKEGDDFVNGRRAAMQKWWKVNEKAFIEKRYSDLVPGEPQTLPVIAEFTPTNAPNKNTPVAIPPASPTPTPASPAQAQEPSSSWSNYLIAAIAMSLCWLLFRFKRKQ